ncbi:MAG: lysophospholipase L1-like esterase [Glaciecola sp.]|jgi:lysophospholipase L1-like esterase
MLYKLVALLAFPLLIAQGKHLRKRALILPEADGERCGIAQNLSKPKLSILILGDSAAAGVGVCHQEQALLGQLIKHLKQHFDLHWALIAKTGAQTKDMISMLNDEKLEHSFDIIITSLGVNDVTSLQTSKDWLAAQQKLHKHCFETFNTKHIIVSGMPPMHKFPLLPQPLRWVIGSRAKAFDKLQFKHIANCANKSYAPLTFNLDKSAMAKDGFHPGEVIYKEWAKVLSKRIIDIES